MKGSVRKKGESWYYRIELGKIDGKRRQIERYGGSRKQDAEKALRQALAKMDRAGTYYEPSEISLGDYLCQWIEDYVKRENKEATITTYAGVVKNHIVPAIGAHKLKTISPTFLQHYIDKKANEGLSKSTVNLILNVLKRSLSYAVQPYEHIHSNPALYVRMPKFPTTEEPVKMFEEEEIQRILNKFLAGHNFYMPIVLAYYTGMRIGECLALTWDKIDFTQQLIYVDYTLYDRGNERKLMLPKTKNSIRAIAYDETLRKIFKEQKKRIAENRLKYGSFYYDVPEQNFVCCKENGEPMVSNDLRYFNRWCKVEGMEGKSFHTLRHTHATLLLEKGVPLEYVSKRLGHASIKTTADIYAHITKQMNQNAMNIIKDTFVK